MIASLKTLIASLDVELPPRFTRIHPLCSLKTAQNQAVYIKRDDELSSGISGSKYRKYAGLIPYLKGNKKAVIFTGSAHSNNLLGLAQRCVEQGIKAFFCIKEANDMKGGNFIWLQQILSPEKYLIVPRLEWHEHEILCRNRFGKDLELIPEGAFHPASIVGLLSLPFEIMEQEREFGVNFDALFLDAGTGLTASVCIAAMHSYYPDKQYFVTLIAGDEASFMVMYNEVKAYLKELGLPTENTSPKITFTFPTYGKSFGSLNQKVVENWKKIMRTEGIIMDALYSVKHYETTAELLKIHTDLKKPLILYAGGSFAARNFEHKL